MARSLANALATTEANSLGSSCQRPALELLRTVVDTSGVPRKALAADVCDGDEPLLSKKLAGAPGRPFSLDDLDALPAVVVRAWMTRYGATHGLKVSAVDPVEVTEQLLDAVEQLNTLAKLARIVAGKPLKAKLDR